MPIVFCEVNQYDSNPLTAYVVSVEETKKDKRLEQTYDREM